MVSYDKQVMHKLLDTYESSILSTGENERTIHIEVKFTKTFLPAYFDETTGRGWFDSNYLEGSQGEPYYPEGSSED